MTTKLAITEKQGGKDHKNTNKGEMGTYMKNNGSYLQNIVTALLIAVILIVLGVPAHAAVPAPSYRVYSAPTSLFASAKANGSQLTRIIYINDTTPNPLSFTLSTDQPWIVLNSTSGTTRPGGALLQIGLNPAGLSSGTYTGHVIVTAAGVANSPFSIPVTLTVSGGASAVAPSITGQPASRTVSAGQTATFSVTASGSGPMSYQWMKNGAAINGASSSSYTTPAATSSDNNAQFAVLVSNASGKATSNSASLTVTPTTTNYKINATPTALSFSAKAGAAASSQSLSVNDTTPGPLPFTLSADQPWITLSATSSTTRPGGALLNVSVTPGKLVAGTYSGHVVINASGVTNAPMSIPVTLTVTGSTAVAPAIMAQPASKSVKVGQTATFSVSASGTAPMTFQWKRNGSPLSGATAATYTTASVTTSDNNAQFSVAVSNSAGDVSSSPAVLSVTAAAVAPAITTQPASKSITSGQTATFSVVASGTEPMTYQWSKNGSPISGATSASYTTPAETVSDNNAQFVVVVSNTAGNATSNAASLTVTAAAIAPTITSHPASKSITAGQTATFSVAATGTAPMTYQWKKNGTAISGATSSTFTTPAETTSDNNAQFAVVVTNAAGNATSNPGTLTVTASTLTLKASSSALNFGSVTIPNNATQNVTLTNSGNAVITISNVTVSGAGFDADGVSSGLILNPGQSATLTATFAPATSGSATGSVTVTSNAAPDTITLSGTGVAQVNHSVSLSWSASTSAVTGYNSYSSTTQGGPYVKLNSSLNASTSYTDTTVKGGKTYFYVVTSVNSSNVESTFSPETSVVIP